MSLFRLVADWHLINFHEKGDENQELFEAIEQIEREREISSSLPGKILSSHNIDIC